MQIATHERCYLFRLTHIGLPESLAALFADPDIKKVGLAFKDDINGLRRRRNFTHSAQRWELHGTAISPAVRRISLFPISVPTSEAEGRNK